MKMVNIPCCHFEHVCMPMLFFIVHLLTIIITWMASSKPRRNVSNRKIWGCKSIMCLSGYMLNYLNWGLFYGSKIKYKWEVMSEAMCLNSSSEYVYMHITKHGTHPYHKEVHLSCFYTIPVFANLNITAGIQQRLSGWTILAYNDKT